MKSNQLLLFADDLLKFALYKTHDMDKAEELVQESYLCALSAIQNGKIIDNPKAYLMSVINNRFFISLRKKYLLSVVSYDEFPTDTADNCDFISGIEKTQEAESVRKELAFMAKIYREVMVRYYMQNQSVDQIAKELVIPKGTVLSRLDTGRQKVKKGVEEMENFEKYSYEPIRLEISNSGNRSIKGEPQSLVETDLTAQNLLYLAYREPINEVELAKAIGIPMPYIEPVIQRLVDGELMKRIGSKVYTDFMLSTFEEKERYIPAQKEFIENNFDTFWKATKIGFNLIRQTEFYKKLNENQKQSLELYSFFFIYDHGIYEAFLKIYNTDQIFPDRPNGGKWIAFGHVKSQNIKMHEYKDLFANSYSGERWSYLNDYLGAKEIGMHVYSPEGFPTKLYFRGENGIFDDDLIKLLHIINSDIKPEKTGFNLELLKSIPYLCECRILKNENGKIQLDIPVLTLHEKREFYQILCDTTNLMENDVIELLREYFKGKKQEIPKHLTSVPLQKQYLWTDNAMLFMILRKAMSKGFLHDGGYDNGVQCPCPMFMVVDK